MAGVEAFLLLLQVLMQARAQSPEQNLGLDLRPIQPLAIQMVQRHVQSLMPVQDGQVASRRLLQAKTMLPDWFVDKDDCYIQYCNQYEILRNASCCPDGGKNGLACGRMPYCTTSDQQQVERCKFQTIARFQNADGEEQRIFPSDCGGLSPVDLTSRHNNGPTLFEPKAAWECAFPDGKCFDNHALAVGLPDKVHNCVTAKNVGSLRVMFTIDLYCLDLHRNFKCDSNLNTQPFDPFSTCKKDHDIVNASCHIGCSHLFPYEYCTFEFRKEFMSDTTIGKCSLHAGCLSPHVESNTIFCSRHDENPTSPPSLATPSLAKETSQPSKVQDASLGQRLLANLPALAAAALTLVFCFSMVAIFVTKANCRRAVKWQSASPPSYDHTKSTDSSMPSTKVQTKHDLEVIGNETCCAI